VGNQYKGKEERAGKGKRRERLRGEGERCAASFSSFTSVCKTMSNCEKQEVTGV